MHKVAASKKRSNSFITLFFITALVGGCGGGGGDGGGTPTGDSNTDETSGDSSLPTLSVASASVQEGNSGTTNLVFAVTLSGQANGNVTVDYATSNGTAMAGQDYTSATGTLTISSGLTSEIITIQVAGDTTFESNETLTLALSNASANVTLSTASVVGTILNDDSGGLNDTGFTTCGDYGYGGSGFHSNSYICADVGATATVEGADIDADPVPAGQDAHFGRDVEFPSNTDGRAGFSFTKVDSSGAPLADQSVAYATQPWTCVQDNVTALMWEVKTDDDGLHDKDWTYTWYNSDSATNGGDAGTEANGSCGGTVTGGCDTEKFVAAVNAAGLCGYSDWRLPKRTELLSLVDNSVASPGPVIDTNWFPNSIHSENWTDASYSGQPGYAWFVRFWYGDVNVRLKSYARWIRLVRGG